jgi:hypothetical protein
MRWKVGGGDFQQDEKRKLLKFALWPTLVGDHYVWLEEYYSVERYSYGDWIEITRWLK